MWPDWANLIRPHSRRLCFGGLDLATGTRIGLDKPAPAIPPLWLEEDLSGSLEAAIENGANHLLSLQAEEGYWLGELEADTTLESDYIYYLYVLDKRSEE